MQLYPGLVDILQPTNVLLPVLEYSNSARIESDFFISVVFIPTHAAFICY
jgi:hypothetical protein